MSGQKKNNCYLKKHTSSSKAAFEKIVKTLKKDGIPKYDLGSYTTIKMLPEANNLIQQNMGKNFVNKNEYLKTTKIHDELVKKIATLFNIPDLQQGFGTATSGSSEAIFLALLAAKWHWKKRNIKEKPNVVLCSNAHLCWYKFAKYLDIEVREIALDKINQYPLEKVLHQIDSNTVSIVAILGCTYLGTCDTIEKLNNSLEILNKENSWDVGIHVDAAIGGFVLPFLAENNRLWDFRLSLVRSINVSSHKYGLVYPGLGWILFKRKEYFNSELRIKSNYLSGVSESYTVNFSKSSALLIAQYFNFLHYGHKGYQKIMNACLLNKDILSISLYETSLFEIVSDKTLPIVVFKFKNAVPFNEASYTKLLRKRNWMLPYYKLSGKIDMTVMRIVIRHDMTNLLLQQLIFDLLDCYHHLLNKSKK